MNRIAHTWSLGVPVLGIDCCTLRELPLMTVILCQLFPCHRGPPWPAPSIDLNTTCWLNASLECYTYPNQLSSLSHTHKMRSNSSSSSFTNSSLGFTVTTSFGIILTICLILAQSFAANAEDSACQRPSLTGMEDGALRARAVHISCTVTLNLFSSMAFFLYQSLLTHSSSHSVMMSRCSQALNAHWHRVSITKKIIHC